VKRGFFNSSLVLVGVCVWTLGPSTALSFSRESPLSAAPRTILVVSQRDLGALNLLGIRYARGEGVKRNAGMAMRFFLRSAMQGYTPAMANIGTLYETGATTGHPNLRRAYAWTRTALSFGVPEEDHDVTVFKLGMIAARLGQGHVGGAERLATAIAGRIVDTCECLPGQETELASNGSL
jgi:hypothetical protein